MKATQGHPGFRPILVWTSPFAPFTSCGAGPGRLTLGVRPSVSEFFQRNRLPVSFNHTIISAKDRHESLNFFRELLELPEALSWGPFVNLRLSDGVLLQFAEPPVEIQMQHYAFLLDDELFDRAYARIVERGIDHWADPQMSRSGQINNEHGGRGFYFKDPAGHAIEFITRPYLL